MKLTEKELKLRRATIIGRLAAAADPKNPNVGADDPHLQRDRLEKQFKKMTRRMEAKGHGKVKKNWPEPAQYSHDDLGYYVKTFDEYAERFTGAQCILIAKAVKGGADIDDAIAAISGKG